MTHTYVNWFLVWFAWFRFGLWHFQNFASEQRNDSFKTFLGYKQSFAESVNQSSRFETRKQFHLFFVTISRLCETCPMSAKPFSFLKILSCKHANFKTLLDEIAIFCTWCLRILMLFIGHINSSTARSLQWLILMLIDSWFGLHGLGLDYDTFKILLRRGEMAASKLFSDISKVSQSLGCQK